MEERIGQQLGSYRLVHLLGQGGFANVYLGEHIHLQTLAAVKVLQMRLVGSNLEQFRNEARTIASLLHPHIVRVLDFGIEDGVPFLVMEYAPHGTLRQAYPESTRLSPIQIVPYVNQIADALYYAHSRKLIHRDIKPENFLLAADRKVLLSDFGLVQAVHNTTSQTAKEMAGTVAYMAPEQMNGKPRPASDQYALGIVVYEWLSGNRPFQGSLFEIATQHIMATPRPLYKNIPGISPEIERVIFSALAKDPQQRFPNVKAFASSFEQACQAMQEATTSMPTTILPFNSLSPFNTVRIAALSQSEATNEATNQWQANNSSIAPAQADVPTTAPVVDSLWQTKQVDTPPQSGKPLPFINNLRNQSLPPFSRCDQPGQSACSNPNNSLSKQPIEPSSVKITSDKTTIEQIANFQRTFIPAIAPVATAMQQVQNTLPVLSAPSLSSPRKFSKKWWIIWTLLLLIVLVSSTIVYALAGGLDTLSASNQRSSTGYGLFASRNKTHSPVPAPVVPGFATIHILPSRREIKNTFTISAVMGTPNSSQSQVQARQVTASQSQSQTTTTTSSKQTPATQATGTLTVSCRSSSSPITINAGTVFTGNDKISVATDTTITTSGCYTTITAHAVNPGQSGNIAAHDIDQPYQGYKISNETAFSQGQDAKTTAVVAQSDIDTTATALENALTPAVIQALPAKLSANERSFGDPQCNATVISDHAAGDEASKVTVTVTMDCTVEAYDYDGAQTIAKALLSNQADHDLGSDYGLIGNITTTVGQPTLVDNPHGTISLPITAKGVWAYQWSNAQKQYLARLVAGKSAQDAKMLLQQQKGADAVNFQLSQEHNGMLPSDASHITVDIASIPGF